MAVNWLEAQECFSNLHNVAMLAGRGLPQSSFKQASAPGVVAQKIARWMAPEGTRHQDWS